MKYVIYIVTLILAGTAQPLFAQTDSPFCARQDSLRQLESEYIEETGIFICPAIEEMAELIGGMQGIQEKIYYTDAALKARIEGRVIIRFYVDTEGRVRCASVILGLGYGLDEIALEAVRAAQFKPAKSRGKPVVSPFYLPVRFTLPEKHR